MNNRNFMLLFLLAVVIQDCVSPQFNRSYRKHIEKQKSEEVLIEVEKKYNILTAKNFLSHIRIFLGAPYKFGGSSFSGMDCSGFVKTVFKKSFNIDLQHNAALQYKNASPIPLNILKLGDLLFFEDKKGKGITHVGIYLTGTKFVHASSQNGVTISNLKNNYYRIRFKGARRITNLRINGN